MSRPRFHAPPAFFTSPAFEAHTAESGEQYGQGGYGEGPYGGEGYGEGSYGSFGFGQ